MFGEDAARGEVELQLRGLLGDAAAKAVDAMLAGAQPSATGLAGDRHRHRHSFVQRRSASSSQLKDAFNTVWEVDAKKISGAWQFIRTYLASAAAIMALGFLLLMSLLFTAALSAAAKYLGPQAPASALQLLGSLISLAAIAVLFAMMFKWLPDTPVEWRDVWPGAAITAALFEIGKFLIGLYIGRQALDSDLRRGGLDRGPADLGLLLVADRASRRRIHPRLRPASRRRQHAPRDQRAVTKSGARSHR